jgi:hypothetical protein
MSRPRKLKRSTCRGKANNEKACHTSELQKARGTVDTKTSEEVRSELEAPEG